MPPFFCPYCPGEYAAPSGELLLTHIRIVHASDPNFSIQCSLNGCERTFKNFRTYQNHRLLHHRSEADSVLATDVGESTGDPTDFSGSDASPPHITSPTIIPDMQCFTARWILKTRETRMLTRSAMQGIIEDVEDLVRFVTDVLKSQTHETLEHHGITPGLIPGLEDVFTGKVTRPFEGLSSFHQQLQYCRSMFNLVVRIRLCDCVLQPKSYVLSAC